MFCLPKTAWPPTSSEAVGRNPGAATKILVQSILAIAFAEAIVFYALFLVQK